VGHPEICAAPDTMVVFGRPKGHRGSYRQWKEENLPPQVVFEILSPGNDSLEMDLKRGFYERYGVEEYYVYDPDKVSLTGWIRLGKRLEPIAQMRGWTSPLLNITFELDGPGKELRIYNPNGRPFATYNEICGQSNQIDQAEQRAEQAEQRAEQERQERQEAEQRAEQERQRAEQERQGRQQAEQSAEQERQRTEQLLARLKAKGINLDDL
jgi:hypothetical protein